MRHLPKQSLLQVLLASWLSFQSLAIFAIEAQEKKTLATVGNEASVNIKRPGAAVFVLVTPSLNGGVAETFTRTDSEVIKNQGIEILDKTIKK